MHDGSTPSRPPALEPLETRQLLSGLPMDDPAADAALTADPPPQLEGESLGGPANDELPSAEPLQFSWLLPYVSSQDGFGPQVALVSGYADGAGGSGGLFTDMRTVYGNIAGGLSFPITFYGAGPAGADGTLTFTASADLLGTSRYLALYLEGTLLGNLFQSGAVSGINRAQVALPRDLLTAAAGDGSLEFLVRPSADVRRMTGSFFSMSLEYQQAGQARADLYKMDLQAGQDVNLSLQIETAGASLELLGPDGTTLSTGMTMDGSIAVAGFRAAQAGTYYIRVVGQGAYTLRVERSALEEAGDPGDGMVELEPGQGPQGQKWQSAAGTLDAGDRDYYALTAPAAGHLSIQAAGGAAAGLSITLYDAAGNVVAVSNGPHLKYQPDQAGTYYAEVTSLDGSTVGEYQLDILTPRGRAK